MSRTNETSQAIGEAGLATIPLLASEKVATTVQVPTLGSGTNTDANADACTGAQSSDAVITMGDTGPQDPLSADEGNEKAKDDELVLGAAMGAAETVVVLEPIVAGAAGVPSKGTPANEPGRDLDIDSDSDSVLHSVAVDGDA